MRRRLCRSFPCIMHVSLLLAVLVPAAEAKDRVTFRMEPEQLVILVDSQPVATYVYTDPKIRRPYFAHVRTPDGMQVTRNHPPVAGQDRTDHDTMHPGIALAFGDLDGTDFWRNQGRIEHVEFSRAPSAVDDHGQFTERKRYVAADGRIVCSERFHCELRLVDGGYLLLWDSIFSADSAFDFGDQEEMGLGVRVATPISGVEGGQLRDAAGREGASAIWSHAADWCDYSGQIDGHHVGIAILCHPQNLRPSWMHARDYGFLAANLFGRKAMHKGAESRIVVKPGETLRLRYGVYVHEHRNAEPKLDDVYRQYRRLSEADISPARTQAARRASRENAAVSAKPNMLLILADDLAWSDLGCYGHPWHETPHLDQLAADGMRFTQAYAPAPICSASRASILTGKTPARLGFEFVTKNTAGRQERQPGQQLQTPPFTLNLPLDEQTIAEQLQLADYATAFSGKWHLNAHHQHYLGWSPTHGPHQQGFETTIDDFGSHPYAYRTEGQPDPIHDPGRYPADSLTEQACAWIGQDHSTPFFLMHSLYHVHTPVQSPCTWLLQKYAKRVPDDSPNREKRIAYAAFVETLDHLVGKLLEALDRSGRRDSTLVVFTSDNGGHPEFAANGPLRGSKWNLYEGGIRVPFIARWPDNIQPGSTCDEPVVGYDLLPTFVNAAGFETPPDSDLDGTSLLPLFHDPETEYRRCLYWHFPYYHPERGFEHALTDIGTDDFAVSQTRPHSAIRRGRHKLLRFYEDARSELYDLNRDPGERSALTEPAGPDAARVRETLEAALSWYLSEVDARLPVPLNDATEQSDDAALSEAARQRDTRRPNIVFLMADDQCTYSMGCYGTPGAKTPHLDELAREGMVFDNHYDTTAICMASRASVVTGMLEFKTGCNFNHGPLLSEHWLKSYPVLLRQAGYLTAFAGKIGFEVALEPKGRGVLPQEDFDSWGAGPGQTHYETRRNPAIAHYADRYPHSTRAYGAFGRDFIRDAAARKQPFCLSISFKAPHRPVTPDPLYDDVYAGATLTKPGNFGREHGEHFAPQSRQGRQYVRFHEWGYSTDYDCVMAQYYQQIYAIDVAVGMIRDALSKHGVADNTVILYTSDNGFLCGSHGYGSKVLPYEESSRVPLIVYDPRHPNSGRQLRCAALTGNVDFAPTILDLAGLPRPANMDGRSLMKLYDDPSAKIHDWLPLINVWGPEAVHSLSIVTRDWKYIYWPYANGDFTPTEELYDTQNDPLEMTNLIDSPQDAPMLQTLRTIYDGTAVKNWKANAVPYHDYARFGTIFDRHLSWDEKMQQLDGSQ